MGDQAYVVRDAYGRALRRGVVGDGGNVIIDPGETIHFAGHFAINRIDRITSDRTILDEAAAAVYGEREQSYGHPRDDFARIAALWNGWLDASTTDDPGDESFTFRVDDVAQLMVLLKMARLMENPTHHDSWVDIAGYAAAGARAVGVDK